MDDQKPVPECPPGPPAAPQSHDRPSDEGQGTPEVQILSNWIGPNGGEADGKIDGEFFILTVSAHKDWQLYVHRVNTGGARSLIPSLPMSDAQVAELVTRLRPHYLEADRLLNPTRKVPS